MSKNVEAVDPYEKIKYMLLSGQLEPGERLQVDIIAKNLGTSRTPVREAIIRLESERIISKIHLSGYFVKKAVAEDLDDLYETNDAIMTFSLLKFNSNEHSNEIESYFIDISENYKEYKDPGMASKLVSRIFYLIASGTLNKEIINITNNINDRLSFARMAEEKLLPSNLDDIFEILNLLRTRSTKETLRSISKYHKTRISRSQDISRLINLNTKLHHYKNRAEISEELKNMGVEQR